jgi:hypothetical protein
VAVENSLDPRLLDVVRAYGGGPVTARVCAPACPSSWAASGSCPRPYPRPYWDDATVPGALAG